MGPEEARRVARIAWAASPRSRRRRATPGAPGRSRACARTCATGCAASAQNPAFAAVVVLTLGLGIGANTAIFSVVNGVLLRPLPYGEPERLVVLRQSLPTPATPSLGFSETELLDYRAASRTLERPGRVPHDVVHAAGRRARPSACRRASSRRLLRRARRRSRCSAATSAPRTTPRAPTPVLVLSHDYWKRRFGGDPGVVGRVFQMNDRPHTVVGVLPPCPQFPNPNDVYMPTSACPFRSSARRARTAAPAC